MLGALKKSLGTKITLWLSFTLIIILATITVINVVYQNRILLGREHDSAMRLADSILSAIRYPMMTGEQDVIQLQFDRFKELKGIEVIHLLDHRGVIKRSTDRDLIGEQSKAKALDDALRGEEYIGVEERERTKGKVYSELRPILNEQSCYGCHGSEQKVLGVLRLATDWDPVQKVLDATRSRNILISLAGLVIMGILILMLLKIMLTKPVDLLIKASTPLAESAGDLTQRIKIFTQDEIGNLADVFNKIIKSMHNMVSQVRTNADKVASSAQEMSSSAEEMNATTQEVSSAVQKVSKGATTQAERIEETFEIMEKTSMNIKQMVANSQTASQAVGQTSMQAESGRVTARETVEKIERLTTTVGDAAKVIQNLGQISQQIGEITETITSIADQTNLLALNAAIEAARAGEAGRGFAVVAEEVRKLAEGSAEAVRKIGSLIRSIQSETNRAVTTIETSSKEVQEGKVHVAKIAEVFVEISKAAEQANRMSNEVAVAGQARVVEVERVVKAINEVAAIAKESAATAQEVSSSTEEQTASMEEMSAATQELARLAMDLKEIVSKFKLEEKEATAKR